MQSTNFLPRVLPSIKIATKNGVPQIFIFWGEKSSRENSPQKVVASCEKENDCA
jgi:hypothetical protein